MTQTADYSTPADILPMTAMVVWTFNPRGFYLRFFPVESVESARDELGGTLADAINFVEGVGCNECGTEASETRASAVFQMRCQSCGQPGCKCALVEDPHCDDVWFCTGCAPVCGCRSCMD